MHGSWKTTQPATEPVADVAPDPQETKPPCLEEPPAEATPGTKADRRSGPVPLLMMRSCRFSKPIWICLACRLLSFRPAAMENIQ